MQAAPLATPAEIVANDMRLWLERAVIGLNLCPFAKAVHVKQQVYYAVSQAQTPDELLHDVRNQLQELLDCPASVRETTLLMAPWCLEDFLDFNDFMAEVDDLLFSMELDGVLQVASFHPDFQFAGTQAQDVSNLTNQAPYPTLHLLREESIDRAVEAFPDAELIFETNIETVQTLGQKGWRALDLKRTLPLACPLSVPTEE